MDEMKKAHANVIIGLIGEIDHLYDCEIWAVRSGNRWEDGRSEYETRRKQLEEELKEYKRIWREMYGDEPIR